MGWLAGLFAGISLAHLVSKKNRHKSHPRANPSGRARPRFRFAHPLRGRLRRLYDRFRLRAPLTNRGNPGQPAYGGHACPATARLRRTVRLVGTLGCLAVCGNRLLGALPGRRSALHACSALRRRQVTRGKRNSRVAALKSSPVPARFAPRAAASGLPLDFRKLAPCSMTARALQARRINNQETTSRTRIINRKPQAKATNGMQQSRSVF